MTLHESYIEVPDPGPGRRVRVYETQKGGFTVYEEVLDLSSLTAIDFPVYGACATGMAVAASHCHFSLWNRTGSNLRASIIRVIVCISTGVLEFAMYWSPSTLTPTYACSVAKLNTSNPDLPPTAQFAVSYNLGSMGQGARISSIAVTAGKPGVLYDERTAIQPIILSEAQRIGVWQHLTAGTGTVDVAVLFRTLPKEM